MRDNEGKTEITYRWGAKNPRGESSEAWQGKEPSSAALPEAIDNR